MLKATDQVVALILIAQILLLSQRKQSHILLDMLEGGGGLVDLNATLMEKSIRQVCSKIILFRCGFNETNYPTVRFKTAMEGRNVGS